MEYNLVATCTFGLESVLKVGDEIDVYVESQEDINGQLILSHRKAKTLKSWENINNSFETGEIINGTVKCRTKGGLIVDVKEGKDGALYYIQVASSENFLAKPL